MATAGAPLATRRGSRQAGAHQAATPNGQVSNGFKAVPSLLLEPVPVDKDNLVQTVVKDGFLSLADIYKNVPQEQWPKKTN
jgi:ABC-type xylose transport system substrate-binding protein